MHTSFRRIIIVCTAWAAMLLLAGCLAVKAVRLFVEAIAVSVW